MIKQIMSEWEINLKEPLIFSLKKPFFSTFNSWFMMDNQRLIMVEINSYQLFNLLASKIHYINRGKGIVFTWIFHIYTHSFSSYF
jgi:hypothetical protein